MQIARIAENNRKDRLFAANLFIKGVVGLCVTSRELLGSQRKLAPLSHTYTVTVPQLLQLPLADTHTQKQLLPSFLLSVRWRVLIALQPLRMEVNGSDQ